MDRRKIFALDAIFVFLFTNIPCRELSMSQFQFDWRKVKYKWCIGTNICILWNYVYSFVRLWPLHTLHITLQLA